MIIKCNYCKKQVDARVVGEYVSDESKHILYLPGEAPEVGEQVSECFYRWRLVVCEEPSCGIVMLLQQQASQEFDGQPRECDWGEAEVVWPVPGPVQAAENFLLFPDSVKTCLREAGICYSAGAYEACTVACRKALESICHEKNCTGGRSLGDKLKELCEQSFIDSKLLDWSGAIKGLGDRGAHACRKEVGEQEAKFALEFATEVARYVFVLNEKYESFKSGGTAGEDRSGRDEPESPEGF